MARRLWRFPVRSRPRVNRPVALEPLEDRRLPSTFGAPVPRHVPQPAPHHPHAAVTERLHPPRFDQARPAAEAPPPADSGRGLDDKARFVAHTVVQGRSMAYSPKVREVGFSYAKLGVAHDTRKVGVAYARAAVRGDTSTLQHLGDTRLVKKVGRDFSNLGETSKVKRVGRAFASFGRNVSDQFNRLFNGSNPTARKPGPRPAAPALNPNPTAAPPV